jgi:hypothetical protein
MSTHQTGSSISEDAIKSGFLELDVDHTQRWVELSYSWGLRVLAKDELPAVKEILPSQIQYTIPITTDTQIEHQTSKTLFPT